MSYPTPVLEPAAAEFAAATANPPYLSDLGPEAGRRTVDEADVLRDEGEAYAAKLWQAGVPVTAVRYQGIIHDFVMLNALRGTHAATAAITQAIAFLRDALHTA